MRKFKKVYFKPIYLTITLSGKEEDEIIEKAEKENGSLDEDMIKEAIYNYLEDKFFKAEVEYKKKHKVEIESSYDDNIEEIF